MSSLPEEEVVLEEGVLAAGSDGEDAEDGYFVDSDSDGEGKEDIDETEGGGEEGLSLAEDGDGDGDADHGHDDGAGEEMMEELVEIDPNAENIEEVMARLGAGEPVARVFSNAVGRFEGHSDAIFCAALSPDTVYAATGGGDDTTFVWEVESGVQVGAVLSHEESVSHVAFSSDGAYLASGDLDGNVVVLSTSDWSVVQELDGPDGIESMAWHPRGPVLAVGSGDATIWMWHVPTGNVMQVFAGHIDAVTVLDFAVDGKTLVSGSTDETLQVWSPKTGQSILKVKGYPFHDAPLSTLAIDPYVPSRAATGALDGSLVVTSLESGKVLASMAHQGSVESLAWTPVNSTWLASASMDGTAVVWNLGTSQARVTMEHPEGVIRVAWAGDQPLLYTLCSDTSIRIWDGRTGELKRALRAHEDIPLTWAVSSDGSRIVSGGDDQTGFVFAPLDDPYAADQTETGADDGADDGAAASSSSPAAPPPTDDA